MSFATSRTGSWPSTRRILPRPRGKARLLRPLPLRSAFGALGEVDPEHGAGPRLAPDVDAAAVVLHDAEDHRQAEPRPLPRPLRREERGGDPLQVLRGNAGARHGAGEG